ncbi:MAG: hypothetical protein ACOYPR_11550 [Saprospiraceae bacterium]
MNKRLERLLSIVALFAIVLFGIADCGFRKEYLATDDIEEVAVVALEDAGEESGDLEGLSGGSGSADDDFSGGDLATNRSVPVFGVFACTPVHILQTCAADVSATAHAQLNLLNRVRPPLFILYCRFLSDISIQ